MASSKTEIVQVGKRKIELSNLSKVFFPEDHIVKAQVIEYYYKVAPTILAHAKGRPLSLVRYPDGAGGKRFFQKNRPDWAPAWIEYATLGEQQADYILANEEATLVWIANLAGIELHQMHSRAPHFDLPDYIVYDFDPPEGAAFRQVAETALEFKEHVESFGYHAFVKTTGRKGLHVVTPIEPEAGFEQVLEATRKVAEPFVESHSSALTLHISKELRHGKMLLDIYRNRTSQTIVAAYSLRGINGAPVSTPLHWEELKTLESPGEFDMQRALKRVLEEGDPWEAMEAYATPLHTLQKAAGMRAKKLGPARTRKTPVQLKSYSRKRSFEKTPEPAAAEGAGSGHAFVIHRHHATRLHYDLRLERDGVLKSWAVPKGLPPRPGILRLAVSVEDHPLEYVNFEGAIPKGEYGGGMMWKFAQGRYQITKEKTDGFYFRLQSRELNGEYRMHRTKEKEWLLERVDNPQTDWLRKPLDPMLARAATVLPDSDDYLFEVKWDGIRALVSLDEGEVRIHGRNHLDITAQFPELLPAQSFRATSGLFDGEIVCLDAKGKPVFGDVIHRMQQKGEARIARASAACPAVCYLFDCLYLDGRVVANEPFTRRREWLGDAVRKGTAYRISEAMEDGKGLLAAVREMGLEGIMAKQRNSEYAPGKRNDSWLKIKTRQTMDCVIIGYTPGKGDRESRFGALHLAEATPQGLKYVGKAGSGFDERSLNNVSEELRGLKTIRKPVKEKIDGETLSTWVEPKLICEVQYMTLTPDGTMREPVFLRLRPDLYMEA